jgi:hypothetical protein
MTLIDSNKVFTKIMQKMFENFNEEDENFMNSTIEYNFFAFKMLEGLPFKTVAGAEMIVWGEINNSENTSVIFKM